MKRVIVVIDSIYQSNASGFIREFETQKGNIAAIVCLKPNSSRLQMLKKPLKFLKLLKPSNLKMGLVKVVTKWQKVQTLDNLKNSWIVKGENSWDLLEKGFDMQNYANNKKIPFVFWPALTPELINSEVAKGPTIFVMYSGGILQDPILRIENAEYFNAHMGEMPTYRGMNVIEWAVLENCVPKVSVLTMTSVIDGGDVIYEYTIETSGIKSIAKLRKAGYEACFKAMAIGISRYAINEVAKKKQAKGGKYYYRMHRDIRAQLTKKLAS